MFSFSLPENLINVQIVHLYFGSHELMQQGVEEIDEYFMLPVVRKYFCIHGFKHAHYFMLIFNGRYQDRETLQLRGIDAGKVCSLMRD